MKIVSIYFSRSKQGEIESINFSSDVLKKHKKQCFKKQKTKNVISPTGESIVIQEYFWPSKYEKSDHPYYSHNEICLGCGHKTLTNY